MIICPIHENDCHLPAGSSEGGQFCSEPKLGLRGYPYDKNSKRLPPYLKADVLRARRAGIEVFHGQQPEPVKDSTGKIHDPLALSHAKSGETVFWDEQGRPHKASARIYISTRGGEYDPYYDDYSGGSFAPRRKLKDLKPEDLTDPATPEDVQSTFRHEMGHILDRNFSGSRSKQTPMGLAREIRAWQYAVEVSPDHTVSARMVTAGLTSHGYFEFRREALRHEVARMNSWDQEEALDRRVRQEIKDGILDEPTVRKSEAFAARVLKSLNNYGKILKKRGFTPKEYERLDRIYIPPSKLPKPGPGRGGII